MSGLIKLVLIHVLVLVRSRVVITTVVVRTHVLITRRRGVIVELTRMSRSVVCGTVL